MSQDDKLLHKPKLVFFKVNYVREVGDVAKKSALQIVLSRVPEVAAEKQSLLSRLVQVKSREQTSGAGEFIES